MDVVPPFDLEFFKIGIALSVCLLSDVLWDEEASAGSFDFEVSLSSSGLEDPVVRVEAELLFWCTFLWRCARRGCIFSVRNRDVGICPRR